MAKEGATTEVLTNRREDESTAHESQDASLQEDDEHGEEGEDWEWQCPDGFPLQEYKCEAPQLCGSCGEMQPEGAAVLRAEESGWVACEECIRVAWAQPVEPQVPGTLWEQSSSHTDAAAN